MPATKRPRKIYRPRGVSTDPVEDAIARASLMTLYQRATLRDPMLRAFDNLKRGIRPEAAWCNLADALNVAEVLAELGIASDRTAEIEAGQVVLATLHARSRSKGTYAMRAAEMQTLETALEFASIQMDYCTQGEMKDAIETVKRRVSAALAGSAPKDAIVCVGGLGVAA